MKKVTHTVHAPDGTMTSKEVTLTESMTIMDFLIKLAILGILAGIFCGVVQYVWTEEMSRQQYCEQGGIGEPPMCR